MTGVIAKSYVPGTRDWLQQAVHISLFTDARLPEDQAAPDNSSDRRGHWADMFLEPAESLGSLLWTVRREKVTQEVMNRLRDICMDALLWLTDTSYVNSINVTTERLDKNKVAILVAIRLPNGQPETVREVFGALG